MFFSVLLSGYLFSVWLSVRDKTTEIDTKMDVEEAAVHYMQQGFKN